MRRGGRAGVVRGGHATIEKLSVWELDGKHGWKSLPIFTAAPTILPAG